jgi:hypothetical protein
MIVRGRDLVKKSFAALHAVYALKSFCGVNGRARSRSGEKVFTE